MKTTGISGRKLSFARQGGRLGLAAWAVLAALGWALPNAAHAANQAAPIPLSKIGAKATADYQGDALAMSATAKGARLQCGFQKLEGCATAGGLWLESTAAGGGNFRVVATGVRRAWEGRVQREADKQRETGSYDPPGPGTARQRLGVRWVG